MTSVTLSGALLWGREAESEAGGRGRRLFNSYFHFHFHFLFPFPRQLEVKEVQNGEIIEDWMWTRDRWAHRARLVGHLTDDLSSNPSNLLSILRGMLQTSYDGTKFFNPWVRYEPINFILGRQLGLTQLVTYVQIYYIFTYAAFFTQLSSNWSNTMPRFSLNYPLIGQILTICSHATFGGNWLINDRPLKFFFGFGWRSSELEPTFEWWLFWIFAVANNEVD